jgi:hypothetical protein
MIDWDGLVLAPLNDVFGEEVDYTPLGAQAMRVSGIYDDAYKEIDGVTGFASTCPVVSIRFASVNRMPMQGDWIDIIRTKEKFVIRSVEPDGHGSIKIFLNQRD